MKIAVMMIVAAAGLVSAPVQAADWSDVRPGTFVGARLTIGGKSGARPSAALTIAPTQNRISSDGMASMKVGEGLAINFTPSRKPTLTLAGIRADQALGFGRSTDADANGKLGISTGGWVAIGVGVAAVVGGAIFLNALQEADENSD